MDGSGRRRILIGGGALLGLIALVGLASRAQTPTGGGHTRALSSHILLEYTLLLMIAAAVVIIPATIYLFVAGKGEDDVVLPPRRNWMLALLLTMGGFALVAVVLLAAGYFKRHADGRPGNPLSALLGLANRNTGPREAVPFDWAPVIVVSSLTVVGIVAAAFVLLRARTPKQVRPGVAAELARALDLTLDDLRADPDARRAVIAAYAQMERALARAGLPRKTSEAPREYLQRTLPAVGAGADSIERLTVLFERAKFSPHAIDDEMKDEAIAALESLRDELRSAS